MKYRYIFLQNIYYMQNMQFSIAIKSESRDASDKLYHITIPDFLWNDTNTYYLTLINT